MHSDSMYIFYKKSNKGLTAFWHLYQLGNFRCVWFGTECSSSHVRIFLFGLLYNLLTLLAHSSDLQSCKCFLSAASQAPLLFSELLIIHLVMFCCFLAVATNDMNFEEKCLPLHSLGKKKINKKIKSTPDTTFFRDFHSLYWTLHLRRNKAFTPAHELTSWWHLEK